MAVRPIVVVPHVVLTQRAEEIAAITDEIRKLAGDMADTMYRAPGIGLAANQVGVLARLIVIDVAYAYAEPQEKKKNPICIINPVICAAEGSEVKEEGCLSVPELGVEIKRALRVQVQGVDLDGKPLHLEAEGLTARALQHEIDHLNGTTVLEHASALKRTLYHRRFKKKARS
jgi:peptide deformylase